MIAGYVADSTHFASVESDGCPTGDLLHASGHYETPVIGVSTFDVVAQDVLFATESRLLRINIGGLVSTNVSIDSDIGKRIDTNRKCSSSNSSLL